MTLEWTDNVSLIAKEVVASIFGSTAGVYTGQPLDTIKVRLQTQSKLQSALATTRQILQNEGFFSLWKGSTPAWNGAVMENMIAFGINKQLKIIWPSIEDSSSNLRPIFSGAVTGSITAILLCPLDVLKCRMQVDEKKTGNMYQLTRKILLNEGFRGLFKGLRVQIIRDSLFFGMFLGVYDILLPYTLKYGALPKELHYIFAGGVAGVFGWMASMPFDVIKTIMQSDPSKPSSMIELARPMVRIHGFPSLFRGLGICSLRAFPVNAAYYTIYEITKKEIT